MIAIISICLLKNNVSDNVCISISAIIYMNIWKYPIVIIIGFSVPAACGIWMSNIKWHFPTCSVMFDKIMIWFICPNAEWNENGNRFVAFKLNFNCVLIIHNKMFAMMNVSLSITYVMFVSMHGAYYYYYYLLYISVLIRLVGIVRCRKEYWLLFIVHSIYSD